MTSTDKSIINSSQSQNGKNTAHTGSENDTSRIRIRPTHIKSDRGVSPTTQKIIVTTLRT